MDSCHLAKILLANVPFEVRTEFSESSSLLLDLRKVLAAKKVPTRILPSEWAKQGKYAVGKGYIPKVGNDVDFYDRKGDKRYGIITRIAFGTIWFEIREDGKTIETHQFEMVDDTDETYVKYVNVQDVM